MNRIYKYGLQLVHKNKVVMPKEAKILKASMQGSVPCIWALVDTNKSDETRTFIIYGTGHEIVESNLEFIETFFQGPYVWHLFELKG